MPNAFAMGRSQKSATVCATRGILELLSPAELEGVMAHELTHVINRDVMVMTLASFFATLAALIVRFALLLRRRLRRRQPTTRSDERSMIVILVSVVVYAISFLLLRALSRYREFAADRGSAVLTGRPSALASALMKISGTMERVPQQDLRAAEGMSAFFIVPARTKNSLMNLFADHPPLEQRLAALSGWRPSCRASGVDAPEMGLRDILTGRSRSRARPPDRLFAISTAYVTLQSRASDRASGDGGDRLPGARDERVRSDAQGHGGGRQGDRRRERHAGRRPRTTATATAGWCCPATPSVEDLAVGINAVSSSIETAGYGERLLCAVFAFTDARRSAPIYFIYNYKRGSWYPFVPAGGEQQRNTERELQLKAQMSGELPIEPELERWFPLWGIPI